MKAKTISIDQEKCRKDGLCATVCPMRIMTHEKNEYPKIGNEELCVLCGQCIAVCPAEAITHGMLDASRFQKITDLPPINEDAISSLLRQRRSVRAYKQRSVPRAVLEEIVQVVGFAPTSAHGGEGWVRSVVIVSGKDTMQKILDLTAEYLRRLKKLMEGFIVKNIALVNPHARMGRSLLPDIKMRLAELEQGRDAILYNAPHALFFHAPKYSNYPQVDCDTALYSVMLLAHAKGLGTCWNGWLEKAASGFKVKSFTALRDFLGIPDHHDFYAAATLGYPTVTLHSIPHRETKIRWIGNDQA
jgi:nitroreductase/NAD-dependent dihydropyrimidine dehydrogenase PreA subunit